MSDVVCGVCSRPVADMARVCVTCGYELGDALREIAAYHGIGWDLTVSLARQDRIQVGNGKPREEDREDEKIPATLAAARETLADVRSAGKDLRASLREARTFLGSAVSDKLEEEMRVGIEALGRHLAKQMEEASDKVIEEFGRLAKLLLAVDQGVTFEDVVRYVADNPGQGSVGSTPQTVTTHYDVLGLGKPGPPPGD